jgi:hypothetical protein
MDWGVVVLIVGCVVLGAPGFWAMARDRVARLNSVYTPETRRLMGIGKAAKSVDDGEDADGPSS